MFYPTSNIGIGEDWKHIPPDASEPGKDDPLDAEDGKFAGDADVARGELLSRLLATAELESGTVGVARGELLSRPLATGVLESDNAGLAAPPIGEEALLLRLLAPEPRSGVDGVEERPGEPEGEDGEVAGSSKPAGRLAALGSLGKAGVAPETPLPPKLSEEPLGSGS